ncbi:hypothetical protein VSP9026_01382 [Vibrio spartinae]|uniref:Uncharacterized protein n=1 Tax=Vibrio spartinae TaxID=1918945 RepID=A0A1N6M2P5_9VIBR|nr:hypothetical protein VSP9026_01382 [Vibrio spartinae]
MLKFFKLFLPVSIKINILDHLARNTYIKQ